MLQLLDDIVFFLLVNGNLLVGLSRFLKKVVALPSATPNFVFRFLSLTGVSLNLRLSCFGALLTIKMDWSSAAGMFDWTTNSRQDAASPNRVRENLVENFISWHNEALVCSRVGLFPVA